ncbi:tryptophan-rich sensory protein [Macrococcus brunensis]|uniref:tryptophan-rich sensory protein n=1 Tax=Macrococcus brunensis TaxID=198483 RepID=UPI001EF09E6D|nr:tryptophan-rich sensory protein [Macrococcus brunensis]ULG72010.1 tryptophan-rich sensory protein [Macrococcus brunensis]ULG74263.1 tryptophan-rich sensory protein [Macrococcus brunensis]
MSRAKVWPLIYLLVFIGTLVMNYLTSMNVGRVANQDQALIQPAGYAFSIWSLIYLFIIIWIIRLLLDKQQSYDLTQGENLTFWPILNFILNGLWIYVFTQNWKLTSVIVIIALLLTLVIIYRKISQHHNHPFDRSVFSIYFAWVTVATIVNIFTYVKSLDVSHVIGLSELTWTWVMLVVATALCVYIAFKYHDFLYPLVFVWAFTAIYFENQHSLLLMILIGCIVVQLITALTILIRKFKK